MPNTSTLEKFDAILAILVLTGSRNRQGFDRKRLELNDCLSKTAPRHQHIGLLKTLATVPDEAQRGIPRYCALTLTAVKTQALTAKVRS